MENSTTYNKQNEIISFITGYEINSFGGSSQQQKITALAWVSVLVALQNALSIALYIRLHAENSMLTVIVFIFGILLFLIVNRTYFISSGNGFKAIFIFMGFYIAISFLITNSVLCYFFLEPEVLESLSSKTALSRYGGYIQLLEHLSPEQERSFQEYKYTGFFLSVIVASLPAISQKLLIDHKELFALEKRNNELKMSLYKKLQQKKSEFANLYEPTSNGFLFGEEGASEEELLNRKDQLIAEMKHFEDTIQNIL